MLTICDKIVDNVFIANCAHSSFDFLPSFFSFTYLSPSTNQVRKVLKDRGKSFTLFKVDPQKEPSYCVQCQCSIFLKILVTLCRICFFINTICDIFNCWLHSKFCYILTVNLSDSFPGTTSWKTYYQLKLIKSFHFSRAFIECLWFEVNWKCTQKLFSHLYDLRIGGISKHKIISHNLILSIMQLCFKKQCYFLDAISHLFKVGLSVCVLCAF